MSRDATEAQADRIIWRLYRQARYGDGSLSLQGAFHWTLAEIRKAERRGAARERKRRGSR